MKVKKLIGLGVLSTVMIVGMTGCNDNIDGTYTCNNKGSMSPTLVKIDNDTWDITSENGDWTKVSAQKGADEAKKTDSTVKLDFILDKDSDNIYKSTMEYTKEGEKKSKVLFTFSVNESKNLLLRSDIADINNLICTKNQ
jgi:hypothetical protein